MAIGVLRPNVWKTMLAFDVFKKWGIDAIGPLHVTQRGKCYILTAVIYLSRWTEAKSIKQIAIKEIVFEDVCCRQRVPLEFLIDEGLHLHCELVDYLYIKFKSK